MSKLTNTLFQWLLSKISKKRSNHPIYILPTMDGLKVICLNLILLAIGMTYANNYILLFNFILFCLLIASMFYTHYNIYGIKFTSLKTNELYVNTTSTIEILFKIQSPKKHYLLTPLIKADGLIFESTFFNINEDILSVLLRVTPLHRGSTNIHSIGIETRFPFNFFTCFTFFNTDLELIVYPEKKSYAPIKITPYTLPNSERESDVTHRAYHLGDNLKRIDWKKVAQSNRWYIKETYGETNLPITFENVQGLSLEESLSTLCYEIQKIRNQNICFGFIVEGKLICTPNAGTAHVNKCLKELALYGN